MCMYPTTAGLINQSRLCELDLLCFSICIILVIFVGMNNGYLRFNVKAVSICKSSVIYDALRSRLFLIGTLSENKKQKLKKKQKNKNKNETKTKQKHV